MKIRRWRAIRIGLDRPALLRSQLRAMLRAGAGGYITKDQPPAELLKAIRQVLDNRVYVSKEVSDSLLQRLSSKSHANRSPMEILTDREFEVFQLIGQGLATKQMADKLHLSTKTIEVHRANIKAKLKIKSMAELIRYAVRWVESERPD